MKRAFILMPMMLPRISDQAAVHLLDILEQLLACPNAAARSSCTWLRLTGQPARVWRVCCARCASSFKVMSLPSVYLAESGQTHAFKSPTTRP